MTFSSLQSGSSLIPPLAAQVGSLQNSQSTLTTSVWAKSAGGSRSSDNDSGNAIAIDSAGNSYITGKLQGSNIAFGSASLTTQDLSPDAFVTKLDASGNFLWTKTFAGSSAVIPGAALDVGQGITVDSAGNVFVIGSFQGTMQLGASSSLTSNGVLDVFVLKLNGTDGNVTWGKNFGSAGIDQGFAIALDSNNNAYITGTFGDTSFSSQGGVSSDASFGSTTLTRTGSTDAFIAKLDGSNGNVTWAKNYGGSGSDTGFGIASTSTGVYVTGNTERAGDLNVFAAKLDSSNGNIIWDKNFGGSSEDTGKAIRLDSSGNAYLTGYLKSSTATFGTIVLQSNNINMCAVKLNNTDGSVAWAKSIGGPLSGTPVPSAQYGNGIGLDGSGNIYIAGSFTSSSQLGTITIKLSGLTGEAIWGKSFMGSAFGSFYGIAVDSTGNSYLTGEFSSPSLTVGNQTLTPAGGSDFFVTKLDGQNPIVPTPSPLDLVFYDPIKGQVSFGFVGNGYNIVSPALTGDTPILTDNATNGTPSYTSAWRMVSAGVDADRDGINDIIVANNFDNSVVVFFGEARTSTDRQYAYTRSGYVTNASGQVYRPGTDWTLDFASNKIGANDAPGLFWRSKQGVTAVWTMTQPITTSNGTTNIVIESSGAIFNAGPNSGWRAMGDGELNGNATTREVFFVNDLNSRVVTWSLTSARSLSFGKLAWDGFVPTSVFNVVGIKNMNGIGNDEIVWQAGSTIVAWNMVDGVYSATGSGVITLTSSDRIKVLADVDADGTIDLVGQRDSDGTIAAYALTSGYALKNTAAPRTQYTANNTTYRPGKGGPSNAALELVNVAQYGV
jgi:Beta-propeller repeat